MSNRIIKPAEFAERMREASECGSEEGHLLADRLMLETLRSLGYGEGCDVFEAMDRWYA